MGKPHQGEARGVHVTSPCGVVRLIHGYLLLQEELFSGEGHASAQTQLAPAHHLCQEHQHTLYDLYLLAKPAREGWHGRVAPERWNLSPMPIVDAQTLVVQYDFEYFYKDL
jgi:hypothetical protein